MASGPTMQDVADRAGVSRALVSLVMNDAPNVSDARRSAVLAAASELGYRPNVLARGLAGKRTNTLGVVVSDLHNVYFAKALDGIHEAAADAGLRVLIADGRPRTGTRSGELEAVETFLQLRVDALVLAGSRADLAALTELVAATPTVLIGRDADGSIDVVDSDDRRGAMAATEHLIELGHIDIVHVCGGHGAGAQGRREGYRAAMVEAGLAEHVHIETGDFTAEGGAAAASSLAQRGLPTAIFAANDLSAVGVLGALEQEGVKVPDDVSLLGYDNSDLAAMPHLSLTTVDQPGREMGHRAVTVVVRRLEGATAQTRVRLAPQLVLRSTTAPPSSHDFRREVS